MILKPLFFYSNESFIHLFKLVPTIPDLSEWHPLLKKVLILLFKIPHKIRKNLLYRIQHKTPLYRNRQV
jgi:hypothetical protein